MVLLPRHRNAVLRYQRWMSIRVEDLGRVRTPQLQPERAAITTFAVPAAGQFRMDSGQESMLPKVFDNTRPPRR